jgi:hypothetical protein
MKNKFLAVFAALIMAFGFVTCGTEPQPTTAQQVPRQSVNPAGPESTTGPTIVPGSSLAAKLVWLQTNAQSNTDYIIEVSADESINSTTLFYGGKTNIGITIIGIGGVRTISLSSRGSLFTVQSGVILTLGNNITLQGLSNNSQTLVQVDSGGNLVMDEGSKITGNTKANNSGGGVVVQGTFTMSGGEISGNTASNGGGVMVANNATFAMSGGEISGNTASSGGGVYVSGTFTMSGGEISGNTSNSSGGGVMLSSATFTMDGGEISGNTSSNSNGGGVMLSSATFTMDGGEISGNTSSYGSGGGVYVSGTFTMNDGTISGNTASYGSGGVYVSSGTIATNDGTVPYNGTFRIANGTIYGSNEPNASLRNTTPSGAALYVASGTNYSGTAQRGTFSGSTWIRSGDLSTTNNTIRVVNGNIQ